MKSCKLQKSTKFKKIGIISGVVVAIIVGLSWVNISIKQDYTKMFARQLLVEYTRWLNAGSPTGKNFTIWRRNTPHVLVHIFPTNTLIEIDNKYYHGVLVFPDYHLVATKEGCIIQIKPGDEPKVVIQNQK